MDPTAVFSSFKYAYLAMALSGVGVRAGREVWLKCALRAGLGTATAFDDAH